MQSNAVGKIDQLNTQRAKQIILYDLETKLLKVYITNEIFKHKLSDRQCTVYQFGSMQSYAVGKIDQLVTQYAKDIILYDLETKTIKGL